MRLSRVLNSRDWDSCGFAAPVDRSEPDVHHCLECGKREAECVCGEPLLFSEGGAK